VRIGEVRIGLVALLCCAASCVVAPAASATFGVNKWEAGTCKEKACNNAGKDPSAEFYTQAAGHPDFGITDFAFDYTTETNILAEEVRVPVGHVRDVRVDLPPGLAVDPEAAKECPEAQIEALECPVSTQIGEDEAQGTAELALGTRKTVTESFPVYNLARRPGESARFGVEVKSSTLALAESISGTKLQSAIYLEGGISWHHEAETAESGGVPTGDYHEFFEIHNIPTQPELIESRLIFWGVPQEHTLTGEAPRAFITMPSSQSVCASPSTTYLHVDSYETEGAFLEYADETRLKDGTPIVATGCNALSFNPSLSLSPETSRSDQPDGARVDIHIPQLISEPSKPDSPDLQNAEVSLPEGMTLNPAAAHGLEGCTNAQIKLGTDEKIECPAGSEIGTMAVNAPGIPDGSLAGKVYLGSPESGGAESGEEFRIFLAAEAPQYGVGLRLEGHVKANVQTGRLTAIFSGDPQVPFEDFILTFRGGPRAPLANPLRCGLAEPAAALIPYTGQPAQAAQTHGFAVDANGKGGSCPAPLPFALTQTTPPQSPARAGAYSPFTLQLARGEGQQYLSKVQTTLPPGLLGAIPSVPLCAEARANAGTCPAASEIGGASASAGAGSEPYGFAGKVYLTGPYNGAPYGLSIVVPAAAGPYNFGNVMTRASIGVGLYSGRAIVTAVLPTIVEGVPLRLRSISVTVNRPKFLFNPTNCGALATESRLSGFVPGSSALAEQDLVSPFQVGECGKLAFNPKLTAATGAHVSRVNGAGLEVKVTQAAHQADIREVLASLPKKLAARITTLRKACPAATFEAGPPPGGCGKEARVGSATVTTPALPDPLTGPAYLVSHGGAAYPDLDVILSGDNGVEVVLVGHTHIAARTGILSSSFESLPDVPISSFALSIPKAPNSVLTDNRNGSLCGSHLAMATTIVAQSGARIVQSTKIAVRNCPRRLKSHKHGHRRHRRPHKSHRRHRRRPAARRAA
jgi:hypothetical protein